MYVDDLEGLVQIDRLEDLLSRLHSVRKGPYGAFFLSHDDVGPSLWIHINRNVAYLHFFLESQSTSDPGFQAWGMFPEGCEDRVHFVQIDGGEGASITMPKQTLVSLEAAYKAGTEFFHIPTLPSSIRWSKLWRE
jgi:hypothetical protein